MQNMGPIPISEFHVQRILEKWKDGTDQQQKRKSKCVDDASARHGNINALTACCLFYSLLFKKDQLYKT